MKVAIVHDDLTQRGGAERVVVSLARLFPDAPIYTSSYDPEGTFPEFGDMDVRTTFLQRLPHDGKMARGLLPLYPLAIESIDVGDVDVVVSNSSRFAHGVKTGAIPHLALCQNPPRFLYQPDDYFAPGGPVPPWARYALAPVLRVMRAWDQRAARRPTVYAANSKNVADRILLRYGRESVIIHPPVDVRRLRTNPARHDERVPSEPYYLVVSRLLAYKRVDLAAAACAARGSRLVVVGDGPARPWVEKAGGTWVDVRGSVADDELLALMHGCVALIHPGEEDFGLMPLEANAIGKPAVTVARGGALETVVDGQTGILFSEQTTSGLVAALDRLESGPWDPQVMREHVTRFDEDHFHQAVLAQVERLLSR